MSEEELVILQNIQYALDNVGSVGFEFDDIQGLLNLYQTKTEQLETALNSLKKEKEKNKELKILIEQNLKYSHNLEKDLFENCSNYVVSKDKIRKKIKEYEGLKEMDMQAYEEQVKPLQELLEEE